MPTSDESCGQTRLKIGSRHCAAAFFERVWLQVGDGCLNCWFEFDSLNLIWGIKGNDVSRNVFNLPHPWATHSSWQGAHQSPPVDGKTSLFHYSFPHAGNFRWEQKKWLCPSLFHYDNNFFYYLHSSLMPLIEGRCSQIHVNLSSQVFRRNRLGTDDPGIDSPSLWPTEPRLHVRS